jgi:tripartite-type tricarboxylate transporter receptor subunit TctC
MKSRLACAYALLVVGFFAGLPSAVAQQSYPNKPITLIVPFAAGGGTDSIARSLAKTLSEKLGTQVIVDNKGGGGGSIGANAVAKAKPDGYTLLLATSTFATHAASASDLPYVVNTDFAPIALLGRGPLMVVATKELGIKNITQLRALAQSRLSGLDFCSAGIGSINHLAGELFKQKANVNLTHVPYKGSAPATVDLVAGRTHVFFATVPTILPFVKDGRVELLAMTGSSRSNLYPNIPTMSEAGVQDFNISTWWGVLAPAKTPKEIVDKLNRTINEAAKEDVIRERLLSEGAQSFSGTPAAFQAHLAKEISLWQSVVKTAGIKIQ